MEKIISALEGLSEINIVYGISTQSIEQFKNEIVCVMRL